MLFFEFINLLEGFLTQLRKADNAIHYINLYPVDYAIVSLILIHLIEIFLLDSAIQRLNNRDLIDIFYPTSYN